MQEESNLPPEPGSEVLGTGPFRHVGTTFADQLHRDMRPQPMDLSQIGAEQSIERLSYIKLQSIGGVPLLDPWWRQGRLECGSIGTQLRQCALNLLVAFGDLNLVEVAIDVPKV